MKQLLVFCLASLMMACNSDSSLNKGPLVPVQLSCEYLRNPSVLDVAQPRLAWINLAGNGERGQKQTAWQVRVASSRKQLDQADLWDSGMQLSSQSTRVKYQGIPLKSRQECWWQVRVWDRDGLVSDWSEAGMWRMGLLDPEDWEADWIGAPWQGEEALPKPGGGPDGRPDDFGPPAPLLRKEFESKGYISNIHQLNLLLI